MISSRKTVVSALNARVTQYGYLETGKAMLASCLRRLSITFILISSKGLMSKLRV